MQASQSQQNKFCRFRLTRTAKPRSCQLLGQTNARRDRCIELRRADEGDVRLGQQNQCTNFDALCLLVDQREAWLLVRTWRAHARRKGGAHPTWIQALSQRVIRVRCC